MIWLLTCEHYSNGIPLKYADYFKKAVDVLESHRGYDVRVAPLYLRLEPLFDQAFFYRYSRLLIEPNRSLRNRFLFSPFTAQFSPEQKADLIANYYQPYRREIESFVRSCEHQQVMHISLHTFASVLGNEDRSSQIGIHFDSSRRAERDLAVLWKKEITSIYQETSVRFNYPYRGQADGITSYLRKVFQENYFGLELEVRNDVALDLRPTLFQSIASIRSVLD